MNNFPFFLVIAAASTMLLVKNMEFQEDTVVNSTYREASILQEVAPDLASDIINKYSVDLDSVKAECTYLNTDGAAH
jgi:hypothetical protein